MNPYVGWGIAAVGLAVAAAVWGWRGAALAVSVITFWLLLQLSRSTRILRRAADLPVGHIDSAVMLQARLTRGLQMLEVMKLTQSLGRRVHPERDDVWAWRDPGGAELVVTFDNGRCARWELRRPEGVAE